MKKPITKQQKSVRRIIILIMLIIVVLFLGQLIYYGHVSYEKKVNHEKIVNIIDNQITYIGGDLDDQLNLILEWIDSKHLSNGDLGRLYERASLIYQQQGAEMTYYRYLGYALYYLENSDDKDYTVNIYLDLANFYINNYSYNYALEMLNKAASIKNFDELDNLQVKSYAYRMQAILEAVAGNNEEAEKLLNKSLEVIAMSSTGIYEEAYIAMDEIWLAYTYLESGRMDECAEILEKYKDSPLMEQEIYHKVLLRDFIVPYYQTKCNYYAALTYEAEQENNEEEFKLRSDKTGEALNEFMTLCEKNGYEKQELSTLLILTDNYPVHDLQIQEEIYYKLDALYTRLLEVNNESYASIIDSQIADSEATRADIEKSSARDTYRNIVAIIIVSALMVAYAIMHIVIINSQTDGLSGLLNRKKLDRKLNRLKAKGSVYTVIMLDIDNFKNINDSYGHSSGDLVIQRLGEILQRENKSGVKAFRYGGEEFTLLLTKDAQERASIIAERVRITMESEKWAFDKDYKITLSMGIASGSGEDVLKKADENLYKSKQSGKNKITI